MLFFVIMLLCFTPTDACDAGFYYTDPSRPYLCLPCLAGNYQPNTGQTFCYPCGIGRYSDHNQAITCTQCPAGKSTLDSIGNAIFNATSCSFCPPTKLLVLSGASGVECDVCPVNRFCNFNGSHACSTPQLGVSYIRPSEVCTAASDAVVRSCTPCLASISYAYQPCTLTTDTVCRPCSVCQIASMSQYELASCTTANDTQCAPCSRANGDMHVGGRCNPCPAGAVLMSNTTLALNSSKTCPLCPSNTYSPTPNSASCIKCQLNYTSAPGSTRCVLQCKSGYYAPDGISGCIPLTSARSMIAAHDPSFSQLQAAAPTSDPSQFMVARLYILTSKSAAVTKSSQLYLMSNLGISWLFAGGFSGTADGVAEDASFGIITQIVWDPLSNAYLVLDQQPSNWVLRWVTYPDANVTSVNTTSQGLSSCSAAISVPNQAGNFLLAAVSSIEQQMVLLQIQLDLLPSAQLASSIPLYVRQVSPNTLWGYYLPALVMPIALQLDGPYIDTSLQQQQPSLFLLDQGLVFLCLPYQLPLQLCGGGAGLMQGNQGETIQCSRVSLEDNGAIDLVSYPASSSSDAISLYILFFNERWSGIAHLYLTLHLGPTASDGLSAYTVIQNPSILTLVWINTDTDPTRPSIPLRFITTNLLHLVYSQGSSQAQISTMGLHGCLCNSGMYCNSQQQCLDAPLGTQAPDPWSVASEPCPLGYVRTTSSTICEPCPQNYTTYALGSWFCEPICPDNAFYYQSTCIPSCNQSLGLYHDVLLGHCLPCWLGSMTTGGRGLESCTPCAPGTFGISPGVCAPCPSPQITTETFAATRCMPSSSSGYCDDGGITCPSNLNTLSTVLEPTEPISSLLVLPNGTVLSFFIPDQPLVFMQFCTQCTAPGTIFQAASNASCIQRAENFQVSSGMPASTLWAGSCDTVATTQDHVASGLLPPIYGLHLMEFPQHVPVLYISSMLALQDAAQPCAEVYALSTFDKTITSYMSQDLLKRPVILLTQCILQPIVLASNNGMIYAAIGSNLYSAQAQGPGAQPQGLFTEDPILQVDRGNILFISAVPSQLLPGSDHLFITTDANTVLSVPPTAFMANGWESILVGPAPAPILGMGVAGRRAFLWYHLNHQDFISEILFSNVQGCMLGYVLTSLQASELGVCIQAGRGYYTDPQTQQLESCPPGTYGPSPAAIDCIPCPSGFIAPYLASAICSPCPDGYVSSADATQCFAHGCPSGTTYNGQGGCTQCSPGFTFQSNQGCVPCPAGTFSLLPDLVCLPCPAGYTSPSGAHSCVVVCDTLDQCSYDGQECSSLTNEYQILSQITMSLPLPSQVLAITVDDNGGVFYTDGASIKYYFDDCASYDAHCQKIGTDLLPSGAAGYFFSALAICNTLLPSANSGCPIYRNLYVTSLIQSSVYVLKVCQQEMVGPVDPAATVSAFVPALTLLAGSRWSSFSDGPFLNAHFNQPADLELNRACTLLYLSDFANHRIRLLNLTSGMVSTLVGSGQACWKPGLATCSLSSRGCDASANDCASLQYPLGIGLSEDENSLYIVANIINSLFVLTSLKQPAAAQLANICGFTYTNMAYGSVVQCNLNPPESKGCMLYKPFDVALFDMQAYVGVTQGITKIFGNGMLLGDGQCEQVAGQYFDLQATGLRDGTMPIPNTNDQANLVSLLNTPFKLAIAKVKGVLYFADMMNGAVRRVLVGTICVCPVGSQLFPNANSCYNPSPDWAQLPMPTCNASQLGSFYALPGDATCSRSCADAKAQGFIAAPCLSSSRPPQGRFTLLTYSQLLAPLSTPQSSMNADWYGDVTSPHIPVPITWNAIFLSTSPVAYRQGSIPGRAPYSNGDFVTLTFNGNCWAIETHYPLQPKLLLPGLWYPCGNTILASDADACTCSTSVFAFEQTPSTVQEEIAAAANPNKRWQALRNAATLGQAMELSQCASPDMENCATPVTQNSMFMMLGTDQQAPSVCHAYKEGPCFPTALQHHSTSDIQNVRLLNSWKNLWAQDGIQNVQCKIGWPAHFYCPNGYTWIPPANFPSCSTMQLPALATCVSCMPGTYSFLDSQTKLSTGGPYQCVPCMQGFFSSAPGSTACLQCPQNTFSTSQGSTACKACNPGTFTVLPAAYSQDQCVDCPPGTGDCAQCIPGEYQVLSGQPHCDVVPPGHFSALPNATLPMPCPPGQYQPIEGRTSCIACPPFSTSTAAGTACTPCPPLQQAGCPSLSIGNICGAGCGLNQYYDSAKKTCTTCPTGTLNPLDPCSTDPNVCTEPIRRDFYILSNGSIVRCASGTQATSDFSACMDCVAGWYSNDQSKGCQPCPPGSISTSKRAISCTPCAPGYTTCSSGSCTGQILCTSCDLGTYAPVAGTPECLPCNAGFVANSYGSIGCKSCPPNTVAPANGMYLCNTTCNTTLGFYASQGDSVCSYCAGGFINTSCQKCGLGHYLVPLPQRHCVQCPLGQVNMNNPQSESLASCTTCPSPTAYASPDALQCIEAIPGYVPNGTFASPCPPGTYRNTTQTSCHLCAPGSIAPLPGQTSCASCDSGQYAANWGQSICSLCPTGKVSVPSWGNSVGCEPCAPGSYQTNGWLCTSCPKNFYCPGGGSFGFACIPPQYTNNIGATACLTCPDWTSYDAVTSSCQPCAPGKFMRFIGQYICTKCPAGTYLPFSGSNSSSDCKQCPAGKVAINMGTQQCNLCPSPGTTPSSSTHCTPCSPGSYNTDGGLCMLCPPGTYASGYGLTSCTVCPAGTFQKAPTGGVACQTCPAGSISDGSTGLECLSCVLWGSTFFASMPGQSVCLPKISKCSITQYLNLSLNPALNNGCVTCTPCRSDQLAIPLQQQLATSMHLLTQLQTESFLSELCPGTTQAPLYQCIDNTPRAGQYLAIDQAVGAAAASVALDPYSLQQCTDPLFDSSVVAWVAGLDIQACYVGCLYGIRSAAVRRYVNTNPYAPYAEDPMNNVFLQRMIPYAPNICTPCPTTECPLGRYRPDYGNGCGPPCALPDYQLTICNTLDTAQGCTGLCTNRPPNSGYINGGPVLGKNWCPWACLPGWHVSDNATVCLPCPPNQLDLGVAAALCNSTNYVILPFEQCMPWHTSLDLCKYCPPLPYATLLGWNPGTSCQYQCFSGYYLNTSYTMANSSVPGLKCLPCNTIWLQNWTICPIGYFLDESQCNANGAVPQCMPCNAANPLTTLVTNGEHNHPSHCRVICNAGFHTVTVSTGVYMARTDPFSKYPFLDDVQCIPCSPSDHRSCTITLASNQSQCFPGFFRNLTISDDQSNSCVLCRESAQCPKGFYALPCDGTNVTDAPCLPCPMLPPNQQFVDYSALNGPNAARVIVTQGIGCPRACINNYVQAQDNPNQCISCQLDVAQKMQPGDCLRPGFQPPLCAFIFSFWNATIGPAWWDAAHAPPYLPYTPNPVSRAGICWACPLGTATLPDSTDLCITLPGYSSSSLMPTAKMPIPSLPNDVYFTMQRPKLQVLTLSPQAYTKSQKRRLLVTVQTSSAARDPLAQSTTTSTALATLPNSDNGQQQIIPRPCPYGTYKTSNGLGSCLVCPQGSSTAQTTSVSKAACMCDYGYYKANAGGLCLPCPIDTFQNSSMSIQAVTNDVYYTCIPCPANQSTLGNQGATRCTCALGFYAVSQDTCEQCPANSFCPPCTTTDAVCPTPIQDCFPGSTSPPGSFTVNNCTCKVGFMWATRGASVTDSTKFYCMALPQGAEGVDPQTGLLVCQSGWTRSQMGTSCQLCPPGYYAMVDAQQQNIMLSRQGKPFCIPCPINTYNPTFSAIGACTLCPSQQITLGMQATSIANCTCPPATMLSVKGGCVGCTTNQYSTMAMSCRDCPPNSLAQPGAMSLADCLCIPGYEMVNMACQQCHQGFYSQQSSVGNCTACPLGSTTASTGSNSVGACGASPDLCLDGFAWRQGVGCFAKGPLP